MRTTTQAGCLWSRDAVSESSTSRHAAKGEVVSWTGRVCEVWDKTWDFTRTPKTPTPPKLLIVNRNEVSLLLEDEWSSEMSTETLSWGVPTSSIRHCEQTWERLKVKVPGVQFLRSPEEGTWNPQTSRLPWLLRSKIFGPHLSLMTWRTDGRHFGVFNCLQRTSLSGWLLLKRQHFSRAVIFNLMRDKSKE